MTDRELLELAAKAAGINRIGMAYSGFQWNPLEDDGDALRLAVKLEICIAQESRNGCVFCDVSDSPIKADEEYGEDRYAATRRAIVRAAAEIGKTVAP